MKTKVYNWIKLYWRNILLILMYIFSVSLAVLIIHGAIDQRQQIKYWEKRATYWEKAYDNCYDYTIEEVNKRMDLQDSIYYLKKKYNDK